MNTFSQGLYVTEVVARVIVIAINGRDAVEVLAGQLPVNVISFSNMDSGEWTQALTLYFFMALLRSIDFPSALARSPVRVGAMFSLQRVRRSGMRTEVYERDRVGH